VPLVSFPGVNPLHIVLRRALLPALPPLANSLTNVPFPRDSVLFSEFLSLTKDNVSCSVLNLNKKITDPNEPKITN